MKKANWLLAALIAFPVASFGAGTRMEACPTNGVPTAQSYTWNFSGEATNLLSNVRNDAMKIRTHSEKLDSFERQPDLINWQVDASQLAQIKSEVNDMSAKLCRLEAIRGSVMPWQKRAIDRAAADDRLLALNTGDAIHFLDGHEAYPWSEAYMQNTENLSHQSKDLVNFVGDAEHLAKLRQEEMQARRQLNNGQAS